jgi:hypothetical protein
METPKLVLGDKNRTRLSTCYGREMRIETNLERLVKITVLETFLQAIEECGINYTIVDSLKGESYLGEIYDDGYSDMVMIGQLSSEFHIYIVTNWSEGGHRTPWTRKDQVRGEYSKAAVELLKFTIRPK